MKEQVDTKTEITGSNSKCENCGADLIYDPNTKSLKCDKCESTFKFNYNDDITKHDVHDPISESEYSKWSSEIKVIKCQTCGAEIYLDGLEYSSSCPYCGSTYVMETSALPGTKPDSIIPFSFDSNQAQINFIKGVKKKFFVPSSLKKNLPKNKIRGLYVPSFVFDANSFSKYNGVLVEVHTRTDSKGKTYTETSRFPISGSVNFEHTNYVEEASSKMNGAQMSSLLPYCFNDAHAININFLRGYIVEHYEDNVAVTYQKAQTKMKEDIKKEILSRYHYDRIDYLNINSNFSNEKYTYCLLPVYVFEFEFKKKKCLTYMNGQTGKIGSGLPKSPIKIGLLVLIIIIIIVALSYLFITLE